MNDPVEKIKAAIPGMTSAQKKVADFIIKNPFDSAFVTVDQLATSVDTSTTTIMRLMTYLDYSGYTEFQKALRETLRNKVAPSIRLETNLKEVDSSNLWGQCYDRQMHNIQETLSLISPEILDKAVTDIVGAAKVYFTAAREGMMVAHYLHTSFVRMFGNCQLLNSEVVTEWSNIVPGIDSTALVFAISYPRYSKHLLELVRVSHDRKAKVITITDSYSSPLSEHADLIFPCLCNSLAFHNSPISAMVIADSMINVAALRYASLIKPRLDVANETLGKFDYYLFE